MTSKPWREVAEPHEDVLKGTFLQAEFAADLSSVHAGVAPPEYRDPILFFRRTFITEGMRLLLDSVVRRLAGRGGDPVIQLQTAFGGGKTHTMLAVYHLAKGEVSAGDLAGVPPIVDAAGVTEVPRARVAVIDGIKAAANQPALIDGVSVRTLWGDLAWQLGKAEGYALVADADASGTSPGKDALAELLARYAPCVVLMDELVAYIRQFEDGQVLTGGTFDSNLTFVQALTEAMKRVPNAVLLASLPESEREAGSARGAKALASLSHYFGRVQALWKPVGTEEAFEIVRRRLFSGVSDPMAAEEVCRSFADYYAKHKDDLPAETQDVRYLERLRQAYPIHPEVFDRLYEDWSTLDSFQRTRGVLKLMAKVIHRLWKDGKSDLLIMPGSLPIYDVETRNEFTNYLPVGWDPVIERDIDGEQAETTRIESQDTRLGGLQACRRTARAVFLGSAPTSDRHAVRGLELERVLLGVAQPGQAMSVYKDALRRLGDRLQYLNGANNRFWFDTRPNLRREMDDRKRRFLDREHVVPAIRERLYRSGIAAAFASQHIFVDGQDVPDDFGLKLVVLPPDASFSRTGVSLAQDRASEILKARGDVPRLKQNRLLFLAADQDYVNRLRDQVRSMLAWQSIVVDVREGNLNLDQVQSRQAAKSFEDATEALKRMVRETYRWLLAPHQEARPGRGVSAIQWESFALNPSAQNAGAEIERVLTENELVIARWAPIHLARLLQEWYWKDEVAAVAALKVWRDSCQYLYMPRLKDDHVFQATVSAALEGRDFFGIAQGVNEAGRWVGFVFGARTSVFLNEQLLLIQPEAGARFEEVLRREAEERERSKVGNTSGSDGGPPPPGTERDGKPVPPPPPPPKTVKYPRFFGSVDLDPVKAAADFSDVANEVLAHLKSNPNAKVRVTVEIEASLEEGFGDDARRTVMINAGHLGFRGHDFEPE